MIPDAGSRYEDEAPTREEIEAAKAEASQAETTLSEASSRVAEARADVSRAEAAVLAHERLERILAEPDVFADVDLQQVRVDLPAARDAAQEARSRLDGLRSRVGALESEQEERALTADEALRRAEGLRSDRRRALDAGERAQLEADTFRVRRSGPRWEVWVGTLASLGVLVLFAVGPSDTVRLLVLREEWVALAGVVGILLAPLGVVGLVGGEQLVRRAGYVLAPFCVAAVAVALLTYAWRGERDHGVVADYCEYGAVSAAQLEQCLDHVTYDDVDQRQTEAADFARGELEECGLRSGPFCDAALADRNYRDAAGGVP